MRDLPKLERNALLHLFSAVPDQVQYGVEHYQLQSQETSSIVGKLFQEYEYEGLQMPYTMEDFVKDYVRENMHKLPVKERLAGLKAEERLAGLKAEERLAGLSKEQIEGYLKRIGKGRVESRKRPPKRSG